MAKRNQTQFPECVVHMHVSFPVQPSLVPRLTYADGYVEGYQAGDEITAGFFFHKLIHEDDVMVWRVTHTYGVGCRIIWCGMSHMVWDVSYGVGCLIWCGMSHMVWDVSYGVGCLIWCGKY